MLQEKNERRSDRGVCTQQPSVAYRYRMSRRICGNCRNLVWFVAAGFVARTKLHNTQSVTPSDNNPAIWPARLAMMAVFFTPLMVAWSEFSPNTPGRVRKSISGLCKAIGKGLCRDCVVKVILRP
jgi:hypothetical protein